MPLTGFDLAGFWVQSAYATKEYVDAPLTPPLLERVERALGYTLPRAYVALAQHQNGGIPARTCHRTAEPTSWAKDHVALTGIFAIGETKPCSLLGEAGSAFWSAEWGYPKLGVYFADCPSAGHDLLCLDYRACGPRGEPRVVHVDQQRDYRITHVAEDFGQFLRGLVPSQTFRVDE